MNRFKYLTIGVAFIFFLTGCKTTPEKYEAFEALNPSSILILPPQNSTNSIDAHNYLASTLPSAVYSRGYYVFPYNTVKTVFEHEGLTDPGMIHSLPPSKVASLFGADAIMYPVVKSWSIDYAVLNTYLNLEVDYKILSPEGQEIWAVSKTFSQPMVDQNHGGGLIGSLIATAVTQAIVDDEDILPAASRLNHTLISTGNTQIPLKQNAVKE